MFPDANFRDARHFVAGNRGASEWIFTGTTTGGKKVEVNGCDIFTFRDDKPSRARTSRPARPEPTAPSSSSVPTNLQRSASDGRLKGRGGPSGCA
jgi:hypothetical protein